MSHALLHASTRREDPPTVDPATGEVRIPLALYAVDAYQGDTVLVLTRADAQPILDALLQVGRTRLEAMS